MFPEQIWYEVVTDKDKLPARGPIRLGVSGRADRTKDTTHTSLTTLEYRASWLFERTPATGVYWASHTERQNLLGPLVLDLYPCRTQLGNWPGVPTLYKIEILNDFKKCTSVKMRDLEIWTILNEFVFVRRNILPRCGSFSKVDRRKKQEALERIVLFRCYKSSMRNAWRTQCV